MKQVTMNGKLYNLVEVIAKAKSETENRNCLADFKAFMKENSKATLIKEWTTPYTRKDGVVTQLTHFAYSNGKEYVGTANKYPSSVN